MLVELVFLLGSLRSACDVTIAALGLCGAQCDDPNLPNGSFTLCASKEETTNTSGSNTVPMRECKYYANGTIDVPTQTIITAWIEVGSRLCIGDEPPPKIVYQSTTEQLEDIFTARANPPVARREGSGNPEPFEPIHFSVDSDVQVYSGELFGEPAKIRFRPISHRWEFSDGEDGYGRSITKAFQNPGPQHAQARVRFVVDYQTDGDWRYEAAEFWLSSNTVGVKIVDPPRRTLLVNPEG